MTVRVIVLLVLIALGAVVWQKQQSAQTYDNVKERVENPIERTDQRPGFFNPDAKGVKPDIAPELNVDVELTKEGPRHVLNFTITEKHGWYVDHVYVDFWYVKIGKNGHEKQVGNPVQYLCHHYLDFGATLVENTTLLDVEFPELSDFGTTENWRVAIRKWGKVLAPE